MSEVDEHFTKRQRDVDIAFARFVREGDVDSLARVFDLAAPRLALIAVRLVRDPGLAEDLVQQVFLEAMRSAEHFDPERPVMPWLVAILGRRAERVRGWRAESLEDPDSQTGSTRETLDTVADRESAQRIAEAVDGLPEPYRQVLSLRLLHGLEPVEIAGSLGRPLGTVHAQLHRGLERLRRSLPRSIAALTSLFATEGLALASVRKVVLGQAVQHASVTGASVATTLGVVWMTKKTLSVCGIALAVFLAFQFLVPDPAAPIPGGKAERFLARAAVSGREAELAEAPDKGTGSDPGASIRSLAVSEVDPDEIVGIVVDQNGRPIGSAWIYATTPAGRNARRWQDGESGPDGRFRLTRPDSVLRETPVDLYLTDYRHDYDPVRVHWGQSVELVFRKLPRVRVEAVDPAHGGVLEDYTWSIQGLHDSVDRSDGLRSDAGLLSGPAYVTVRAEFEGRTVLRAGPERVEIPRTDHTLRLVVPPFRQRSLRLLDAGGEPVSCATVEMIHPRGSVVSLKTKVVGGIYHRGLARNVRSFIPFRIDQGTTDRRGELLLEGPTASSYVLRIRPLSGADFLVEDFRFDLSTDAEIRIPIGQQIRLQLGSPELLSAWPSGDIDLSVRTAELDEQGKEIWRSEQIALRQDMTFEVPAGRFQLGLYFRDRYPGHNYRSFQACYPDPPMTAVAGGFRTVRFDLERVLTRDVQLRVLLDGEVVSEGGQILGKHRADLSSVRLPAVESNNRDVALLGGLSHRLRLFPGSWLVEFDGMLRRRGSSPRLRFDVLPTDDGVITIELQRARLPIRVVDEHGQPKPSIGLLLWGPNGYEKVDLPATDGDGRTALDWIAGKYTLARDRLGARGTVRVARLDLQPGDNPELQVVIRSVESR